MPIHGIFKYFNVNMQQNAVVIKLFNISIIIKYSQVDSLHDSMCEFLMKITFLINSLLCRDTYLRHRHL